MGGILFSHWTTRRWRFWLVSLLSILLLGLFPVISVVIGGMIARAAGCHVDEAGVYPCIIAGRDVGEWLSFMNVMGWLMIATLPLGAGLLLLWLVAWSGWLWQRYRQSR
ncbi:hypothetical protein [Pantoea sp. A4]|uniref:hypothetical protein n=1 Tax=Pantoea sp. A4 TaxID=1225184 RepID=UPI0003790D67|nr:hypothetical protein [Pantoea sp. A4]